MGSFLTIKLFTMLIHLAIRILTPELVEDFIFKINDFIEEKVLNTETLIDNALVIPILELIRDIYKVPAWAGGNRKQ